eukprot:CAMPEP_0204352232 /NCGR_PEP_ID=MMETSP0469-20131031/31741_1 /ASSEMBLY_ACC=CAM_ASM_000384 /TAXON_ID=2969 /ORGANISM="Oxyrrhis marina" /LENGTH=194 /DNA_ID=CAMNT_0051338939 /DNA_START=67 /DNA_END=652 /DNA_ORIENTATION=+
MAAEERDSSSEARLPSRDRHLGYGESRAKRAAAEDKKKKHKRHKGDREEDKEEERSKRREAKEKHRERKTRDRSRSPRGHKTHKEVADASPLRTSRGEDGQKRDSSGTGTGTTGSGEKRPTENKSQVVTVGRNPTGEKRPTEDKSQVVTDGRNPTGSAGTDARQSATGGERVGKGAQSRTETAGERPAASATRS